MTKMTPRNPLRRAERYVVTEGEEVMTEILTLDTPKCGASDFVGAPEYREEDGGLMVYGDAIILYGDEDPDELDYFAYLLEAEAGASGIVLDHNETVRFLEYLSNEADYLRNSGDSGYTVDEILYLS